MTQMANADIYVAGHIHRLNHDTSVQEDLTQKCVLKTRQIDYVRLGTYKDGWGSAEGGFEVEKNHGPRPLGGYWCKFGIKGHEFTRTWMKTE